MGGIVGCCHLLMLPGLPAELLEQVATGSKPWSSHHLLQGMRKMHMVRMHVL